MIWHGPHHVAYTSTNRYLSCSSARASSSLSVPFSKTVPWFFCAKAVAANNTSSAAVIHFFMVSFFIIGFGSFGCNCRSTTSVGRCFVRFASARFRAFLSSGRRTVPLPEGGEQAAGRLNVLAPRGADRRRDASPRQLVAQTDHRRLVGSLERSVGNRVEADQVDPAAEPCEQPRQRGDVRRRIVDSAKDDVLEADSALMREVVPPQLGDHLLDRIAALGGHHGRALGGDRVVQADGQMHPGPSQQLPHGGNHADRRHGDPRRLQPYPQSEVSTSIDRMTCSALSSGSPMPM